MCNTHAFSKDEGGQCFKRVICHPSRKLWIVEDQAGLFGFAQFSDVRIGRAADWGFYLWPDGVNGSGITSGNLILDYTFSTLELSKICGQVVASNLVSSAFQNKMRFREEDILGGQQIIDEIRHTIMCLVGLRQNSKQTRIIGKLLVSEVEIAGQKIGGSHLPFIMTELQASPDVVIRIFNYVISTITDIASIVPGAAIFAKHFALDRLGGSPEDRFSFEPKDLWNIYEGPAKAWSALGIVDYNRKATEAESARFRRSLYCSSTLELVS
jgi:hypothetical protein